MRRVLPALLVALAVLFLAWELIAVVQWIRQSGGLGSGFRHFGQAIGSDWMARIVVSDHLVIAGTVLIALWLDAARLGWRLGMQVILAVGFIGLGSPTLLLYLAWRLRAPGLGTIGQRTRI